MSTRASTALGLAAAVVVVGIVAIVRMAEEPPPPPASVAPSSTASVVPSAAPTLTDAPSADATATADAEPSSAAAAPPIAWEDVAAPEPGASVRGVSFLDGRWYAAGEVDLTPRIWFSDDGGATWSTADVPPPAANEYAIVTEVLSLDGALFAIGHWGAMNSDQNSRITWRSDDGLAWQVAAKEPDGPFTAIVDTGETFIAAVSGSSAGPQRAWFELSDDGVEWRPVQPAELELAQLTSLAMLNDRVVAVGARFEATDPGAQPTSIATAWFSDDGGETWLGAVGIDAPGVMRGVVEVDGLLVAVGGIEEPLAWTSSDGETWMPSAISGAPGAVATISAIAPGALVAVGGGADSGPVQSWTSADGLTWQLGDQLAAGPSYPTSSGTDGEVVLVGGSCFEHPCESLWRGSLAD